ncbi:MAG: trans-sulfuration enzyme family protein [Phototrophicaceae bacterium]|jgi:cystathionine gamma-synthase
MELETLAVHAGNSPAFNSRSVAPDLVLSTTFERNPDGNYDGGYQYTRGENPNRLALEGALAQLEGGSMALAFGSGLAAVNALLQTLAPGDHVLLPDDLYHGTRFLIQQVFGGWGIQHSITDFTDIDAVRANLQPNTKLVWIETPSNPSLKIADLSAIAALAHDAGAIVAVDNTLSTAVIQRPLTFGADVVMYSTTKYIGGHSDVLGGALIVRHGLEDGLGGRLKRVQKLGGGVPSPFDCWLLLRSIPTLPLRVRQQSQNALQIAQALAAHPNVEHVYYPGLASHPQHALATRQMPNGFGGLLSFRVRGGESAARAVANGVKIITQATSLGGVETLIEHRASVEGPNTLTPRNLLRLSVGIEHAADLITDLTDALDA